MNPRIIKLIGLIIVLGVWYIITSPSDRQLADKIGYPLPEEIKVIDTSFPFEIRERKWVSKNSDGTELVVVEEEKILKVKDIDFSRDFHIKTERYRLVKDDDWLPSRLVGHCVSVIAKLFFWDWQVGLGLDESRSRAVLSMLEQNEYVKGLTVRINHNEVWYDCYRLFGDDDVKDRNNFLARLLMGLPTSIFGELFAEFRRGDYYNPMNQTVVLYSDVESVSAHEFGHHIDFQRFSSDWEYGLADFFPPVKLYKEWQASSNANIKLLPEWDKWQFYRYLLPAFLTYLIAGYYVSKKYLENVAKRKMARRGGEDRKPYIFPLQTLRHYLTVNAGLCGGVYLFSFIQSFGHPFWFCSCGFVIGVIGMIIVLNLLLQQIIPYAHEGI